MKPRRKIKVKRLRLTKAQLERARASAEEEFKKLTVWVDNRKDK